MDYIDLTQTALAALQPLTKTKTQQYDRNEAYSLVGKFLGALIRKSRLNAARSIEECAGFLQVEAQLLDDWEYGEQVPSLPHLELLANFLTGTAGELENGDWQHRHPPGDEYLVLRQRLIGAMLRAARESTDQSIEELSAFTALDVELLEAYENGTSMIPLSHLTALAQAVEGDLSDFTEPNGAARAKPESAARSQRKLETGSELRLFAKDSQNEAFIRLAMAFRHIERQNLHRIADALFAILKAREDKHGGILPAS